MSLDKDTHQFAVRIAKSNQFSLLHFYFRAYFNFVLHTISLYIGCCLDVIALAFLYYVFVCMCTVQRDLYTFLYFTVIVIFYTRLVHFIL